MVSNAVYQRVVDAVDLKMRIPAAVLTRFLRQLQELRLGQIRLGLEYRRAAVDDGPPLSCCPAAQASWAEQARPAVLRCRSIVVEDLT